MHRKKLLSLLQVYSPIDTDEKLMKQKLEEFVKSTSDCFDNNNRSGHITASAWIVDFKTKKIGMVHHKKLNRWFQPGGHSDGNSDTPQEALREAHEEFGIPSLQLASEEIFDIDIHIIPEDKKRDLGPHPHYDVRFLVIGDSRITPSLSDESHDAQWVSLDKVTSLNGSGSITRMVAKTEHSSKAQ